MIIVSDTSPLNYLILCNAIDTLPVLYGQVFIPRSVAEELHHIDAPEAVRTWLITMPSWLQIQNPTLSDSTIKLNRGETDAILLAQELLADRLLIDERAGTTVAQSRGLHPIGTLGVLVQAAMAGLLDFSEKIKILEEKTNFRMSDDLKKKALALLDRG